VRLTGSSGSPDSSSLALTMPLDMDSLQGPPVTFHHYNKPADPTDPTDTILHWYGQNVEDNAAESFRHDKAILEEYIRSNNKLTAQLAFMRSQRKKKQPDNRLVEDYRFIASLYKTLKKMEHKVFKISISVYDNLFIAPFQAPTSPVCVVKGDTGLP
jgi:hypothetical protein